MPKVTLIGGKLDGIEIEIPELSGEIHVSAGKTNSKEFGPSYKLGQQGTDVQIYIRGQSDKYFHESLVACHFGES